MRRGAKTGIIGAVLLGLLGVGAVLTWTALDKKITIQVDGAAPRTVHTMSGDVRGALADAGYPLGAHDQVTPAANKSVREGLDIHLLRGRLLTLTVDGKPDNEWVAATTVGDALALLGFDTSAYSSLPASDTLPLAPTAITVRTAKSVTLIRAGKSDSIASTAPSVGALLAQQGITVGPNDMLSMPPSTPLTDLMTITWKQVRHRTVTAALAIPYGTSWQDDAARPDGQSTVVTAGVAGVRTVTYDVLMVDGQQIARTAVSDVVTTPPVTQVVSVGTKVVAAPPPSKAASGPTATSAPSTAAPKPATSATSPTTSPTPDPVATPTPTPHPVPTPTPTPHPVATPTPTPHPVVTPTVKPPETKPVTKPVSKPAPPPTKPVAPPVVIKPAPKPAPPKPAPPPAPRPAPTTVIVVTPGGAQAIAKSLMPAYGWNTTSEFSCLVRLWNGESGWRWNATNPSSGAYGIPQAWPANRMATAGADWKTNARTQIRWGMGYIKARYGTPCAALKAWLGRSPHWY